MWQLIGLLGLMFVISVMILAGLFAWFTYLTEESFVTGQTRNRFKIGFVFIAMMVDISMLALVFCTYVPVIIHGK